MSEKKRIVKRREVPKRSDGDGALRRRSGSRGAPKNQPPLKKEDDFSLCHIKKECGSCVLVNDPYKPGLKRKFDAGIEILRENDVLRSARVLGATGSPRELAYRSVAKLAVRKGSEEPFEIGLFQPGSHKVVDVSRCPVHIPAINRCVRALKKLLNDSALTPWDEQSLEGDIRYIIVRAAHQTQELSLTFVCKDETPAKTLKEIVKKIQENLSIHGAYLNCNPDQGNHIFGKKTVRICGGEKLRERLCDLRFEISPASFFQVNPWQATNLYRRIGDLVGTGAPEAVAWDLYSGVGPISMILARNGYKTVAIEENPNAVADAGHHNRINGFEDMIHNMTGCVELVQEQIPKWGQYPQVVVVNPSRRGIAPQTRSFLKKLLSASSNTQLIYVSCDINTLARDLADLQQSGRQLRQIEAFDMFAQTDKLEWLAVIT